MQARAVIIPHSAFRIHLVLTLSLFFDTMLLSLPELLIYFLCAQPQADFDRFHFSEQINESTKCTFVHGKEAYRRSHTSEIS
jgi:hypothetical protein